MLGLPHAFGLLSGLPRNCTLIHTDEDQQLTLLRSNNVAWLFSASYTEMYRYILVRYMIQYNLFANLISLILLQDFEINTNLRVISCLRRKLLELLLVLFFST